MQIVNLFYEMARQHLQLKGFAYGKSHAKGAGNDFYPLLWMDDPVYARREKGAMVYSVNLDFLGIPEATTDGAIAAVQSEAMGVAVAVIDKINKTRAKHSFSVRSESYITLRNYYDDAAAGVRCSVEVAGRIPADRCADDFDPSKQLEERGGLPEFLAEHPEGCAVFNDKPGLPSFRMSDAPPALPPNYAFYRDTDGKYILTKNGEFIAILNEL